MQTDRRPLGPIDRAAVERFWDRHRHDAGLDDDARPAGAFQFGDSLELADDLLGLVVDGPKRATAGSLAEYEADDEPTPCVGDLWVVCDGAGAPRAIIRTTDVRIGPLSSVDDRFAWDEGEGDRTRADWLRAHTRYFTRAHARLGAAMHPDIPVVFERFELVTR